MAGLLFYRLDRWGTTPSMHSMWAGTLSFGLVDIPVRLGPATRPRELAFRQVHAEDGGRITFRRSCTACGADVPYAQVAKAYQRPDGGLVPLTDEDLASLPLEASHRIDVLCFTSPSAIDPLLVSRSYFLAPDDTGAGPVGNSPADNSQAGNDSAGNGPAGTQAYALFRTALGRTGRVAVARITLRQRQARAAVWPRGDALVLQTLLTQDEIADPPPHTAPREGAGAVHDSELAELTSLITAMTRDFDPAAHHDDYRDQLEDLIRHR